MSSGASQLIKESSIGRTNTDAVSSRQSKLGSVWFLVNFCHM